MSKRFCTLAKLTFPLLMVALLLGAAMIGCSTESYDEPTATRTAPIAGQTQNVLIDTAILQGWIEQGLVNNDQSWEKVVILDVTDASRYGQGHIPGAQLWDMAENYQSRVEGPALSAEMVLDGPSMDKMLQKHGIDERTTIVITSSFNETHKVLRAYFQFRYWGFPKDRLKVLDGFNGVWPAEGLTTEVPVVAPSSFSVRDRGEFNPDIRMSLPEMIMAVKSGTYQPVDFRGAAGPTTGNTVADFDRNADGQVTAADADYVVFEGVVAGGKLYDWKTFNLDYAGAKAAAATPAWSHEGFKFKSAAAIVDDLKAADIDNSKTIITACRSGNIASAALFVMEAIVGWDAKMYDGSWSQWGQMSTTATGKGGKLAAGSLWATDLPELTGSLTYNADVPRYIEVLPVNAQAQALYPDPSLPEANQIENEDADYMKSGGGSAPGSSTGGSGGGC